MSEGNPDTNNNFQEIILPRDIYTSEHSTQLQAEEIISYVSDKIEYTPWKGILVFIRDATFPFKGFPTPEAVGALNIIKELIKQTLRHPQILLFTPKNTLLQSFNIIFDKAFTPYKVKPEYLCPTAFNSSCILEIFLTLIGVTPTIAKDTAYNLSHLLEYDDAYRYRLQDIMEEYSFRELQDNPRKEINRLFNIFKERSYKTRVHLKLTPLITLITTLLLIPRYKRAFRAACTWQRLDNLKYDEADKYWACLKGDEYLFTGRPYEERTADLKRPQAYKINR